MTTSKELLLAILSKRPTVRQMISAEMLKDIGGKSADVDEVGDV